MLIGISGKKRSGKDTVGKYLVSKGFERRAFADELKKSTSAQYGVPLNWFHSDKLKDKGLLDFKVAPEALHIISESDCGIHKDHLVHTPRTLCIMEAHLKRMIDPNFYVKLTVKPWEVKNMICLTDVRYPNEAKWIKANGGIVIRVNREGLEQSTHISETALDKYKFDLVINNDGTIDELYTAVNTAINLEL